MPTIEETKYRAWDKRQEKMIYEDLPFNIITGKYGLKLDPLIEDHRYFIAEGEFEFQKYIGKKDKTGREIYEGDILSFAGNVTADDSFGSEPNGFIYDETSIHRVIWNSYLCGFDLDYEVLGENWKYKRDTRGLLLEGCCEIIGNIFENAELLEKAVESVIA
jgi:uncharacterized phage protein (TIGR01671 family)